MSAKTSPEKIAALEEKKRRLEARIRSMRALDSKERRRRDARVKIIVGSLVLRHRPELVASLLLHALDRDRELVASALRDAGAEPIQSQNQSTND